MRSESLTIQKANAAAVMGCFQELNNLKENFFSLDSITNKQNGTGFSNRQGTRIDHCAIEFANHIIRKS